MEFFDDIWGIFSMKEKAQEENTMKNYTVSFERNSGRGECGIRAENAEDALRIFQKRFDDYFKKTCTSISVAEETVRGKRSPKPYIVMFGSKKGIGKCYIYTDSVEEALQEFESRFDEPFRKTCTFVSIIDEGTGKAVNAVSRNGQLMLV
jgi:hypothetical protein